MGTKTDITWEQFLASGKEGQKCEWVDGEVVQMTPVNLRHEAILARLIGYLDAYCTSHPEWIWFPSNGVFTMASGNWRLPDASLVRKERFPGGAIPAMANFPPDTAFEIISPSDRPTDIQRKRLDYLESGVIQVWIDPETQIVELIQPKRPPEYSRRGEALRIPQHPDFSLPLERLFTF